VDRGGAGWAVAGSGGGRTGEETVKRLFAATLTAVFLSLVAAAQTGGTPGRRVTARIDATRAGTPISPYLYGQFIEHIGDLVNHSLWAEMLDDRKFYNPITSNPGEQRAVRGRRANRWVPVGPDSSVTMDTDRPWAGDHSPRITLAGAEARGIRQGGIVLRKGKSYTGRIVLSATPGAKIAVSLVWGSGAGDRQSIPMSAVTAAYKTIRLKLAAGGDTDDGRIEIAGTGEGSFHIGAVSLMPADNVRGFRPDIVALLKAQRSGMYRFPGGNFLSNHDWHDAVGDPDKRPPTWDYVWSAIQPNDVGTDEFMTMCELLGVDAFISVNAGFGDAHCAAELVEYVNGSTGTPMGKARAANGHPAPYNVKWWGIGNEMYGSWQFGQMPLNQYVIKHNMFAKAMRKVDPGITLLATGATPDEMTIYLLSLKYTGKLIPEYLSDGDWDGGLFTHCFNAIDIMSEHFYSYAGQRFDHASGAKPGNYNRTDYMVKVDEPLVEWARRPANRVRNKVEAYDEYLQRIPALKTRRIPMAIDEWAYTGGGNNLKGSLANAMVLQEILRHSDLIKMAGHTMATASIEFNATEAALNTTGLLFKLYRDHFGTVAVPVDGDSPVPAPMYPVGADQPLVNAGSPTYPLDVAAALTDGGKSLTVAVVNPTESAQSLDLSVSGISLRGKGRMWRMTAPALAAVTGLNRQEVKVTESPVDLGPNTLDIAPISIAIYEFERQ
jgi:alpha-L-arabinofuranosidase